jgi:hypothetical protein
MKRIVYGKLCVHMRVRMLITSESTAVLPTPHSPSRLAKNRNGFFGGSIGFSSAFRGSIESEVRGVAAGVAGSKAAVT